MKNIFENLNFSSQSEIVSDVFRNSKFRIERILSHSHTTSWQEQDEDEWVCLLQGEAKILFDGELGKSTAFSFLKQQDSENHILKIGSSQNISEISSKNSEPIEILLQKGDTLFIPAGTRHRVSHTSLSCLWLCVFA